MRVGNFVRVLGYGGQYLIDYLCTHAHSFALSVVQAYDASDGADYRGSRKITLGLLSGSLLPLWSALEKTVVQCRADMTQAEQALKVMQQSYYVSYTSIPSVSSFGGAIVRATVLFDGCLMVQ